MKVKRMDELYDLYHEARWHKPAYVTFRQRVNWLGWSIEMALDPLPHKRGPKKGYKHPPRKSKRTPMKFPTKNLNKEYGARMTREEYNITK